METPIGGDFSNFQPEMTGFLKGKYRKADPLMTDDTTPIRLPPGADDSDTALSE